MSVVLCCPSVLHQSAPGVSGADGGCRTGSGWDSFSREGADTFDYVECRTGSGWDSFSREGADTFDYVKRKWRNGPRCVLFRGFGFALGTAWMYRFQGQPAGNECNRRSFSPIFNNIGYQQIWEQLQPCVSQCIGEYSTSSEMQKESVSVLRRVTYIIKSTCSSLSVKPRDCFDTMRLFVQRTGYSYDSKLCLLVSMFDIASRQMLPRNDSGCSGAAPGDGRASSISYREELESICARLDNLERALCVYNKEQNGGGDEPSQDTSDGDDANSGDSTDKIELVKQLLDLLNSSGDTQTDTNNSGNAILERLFKHLAE